MKRKKCEHSEERGHVFINRSAIVFLALSAVVLGILLFIFLLNPSDREFPLKAIIVDQLGMEFPNSNFSETGVVASMLKDSGFQVSYRRSETVNVAFYMELAQREYGIIILRSHSATREDKTLVDFFTSEEFNQAKYTREQEKGWLTMGYYQWKPEKQYFAVTPELVENLKGSFPKSVVIAMGCNSLNSTCTEMAEAFINKGAKAYIGWTGLVQPSHTDNETIKLLEMLLIEEKKLSEAINAIDADPIYGSKMEYCPSKAGNLTISSLTSGAKDLTDNSIASIQSDFTPALWVCCSRSEIRNVPNPP